MGKLLRKENLDALNEFLDLLDPSSEIYGRLQKQQEMWREKLIKSNTALNEFIEQYPDVDRQQLRNLIRNTQRSEEHTSELQSRPHLVCRLLLEKKKRTNTTSI